MSKPVVLCILDGWGMRDAREANAVALADTPAFDRLQASQPFTTLTAHGPAVGLPEGQMGNSEVGHMNIGAGRIVWMDLPRIDLEIEKRAFDHNTALVDMIDRLKASGGTAHIMGLVSPGGVHAHQAHIAHAAHVIAAAGIPVAIHAFTDGRDVAPQSARGQIADLSRALPEEARIATVIGRYFAMDRDNRWERIREAWRAIVEAEGRGAFSAVEAVLGSYDRGITDEFIKPVCLPRHRGVQDGDGLLFMNFRADRARELLSAILDPDFDGFERERVPELAAACGLVSYSEHHDTLMTVMYPPQDIRNGLGDWVAAHGKRQFRLAETEKYPHVTFFFNGGSETSLEGEARHMAPSPKVATYDLAPEMAAEEVGAALCDAIACGEYDLIVVNFANPDMVGHTGDLKAAIRACESVDRALGAAWMSLTEVGGAMLVTADHGNCEMMVDPETGGPHTAHTLNPVPLILVGGPNGVTLADEGKLADLAPTLLELMGLPQPPEMTGESLLRSDA